MARRKFHLNKMWVQNVNVAILNFTGFFKNTTAGHSRHENSKALAKGFTAHFNPINA